MRVLIADKLPDSTRARLLAAGYEVVADASLKDEALVQALRDGAPDALVVRGTKVNAAHLEANPRLTLVIRAGAGVNTIDLATASSRGIYVTNCPGKNAEAVAELTWAHILNADRRLADNVADLRASRWNKGEYGKARGVHGRTLGVIGCGTIGRLVIERARAFGMRVVAWSRNLGVEEAEALGVERAASAVDVAAQADVVSVHLALTPDTRGLVGSGVFAVMRPGAIFVNTSRGEVVDEEALARAVQEKGLRVGLDVFLDEPAGKDGTWQPALAQLPGVYGTHHIGASTDQAQEAVADEVVRILLTFQRSGQVLNCVNLATDTKASHLLVVRHADQVGVLAMVLTDLREAHLNVQGMENIIFSQPDASRPGAACARIQVQGTPPDALLEQLRRRAAIFDVQLVPLA